jgi:hypothetical protein
MGGLLPRVEGNVLPMSLKNRLGPLNGVQAYG